MIARVAQHLPNLENGRVDAGIEIGEDVRTPQPLRDVLARHQLLSALQQQQEEIHRLPRERHAAPLAPHLVGGHIDFEISEAVGHGGVGARSLVNHLFSVSYVAGRLQCPSIEIQDFFKAPSMEAAG